jgi:hypothetical protein
VAAVGVPLLLPPQPMALNLRPVIPWRLSTRDGRPAAISGASNHPQCTFDRQMGLESRKMDVDAMTEEADELKNEGAELQPRHRSRLVRPAASGRNDVIRCIGSLIGATIHARPTFVKAPADAGDSSNVTSTCRMTRERPPGSSASHAQVCSVDFSNVMCSDH